MEKENNIQLKVWWRHWSVVFILAMLAGLVIWSMLNLGSWLHDLQDQRAAAAIQKQLDKLYREDKYGAKTPEGTFDLFISALESSDVELASKYFVLNKQAAWLKTLSEYENKALLSDFVAELKNIKNTWKKGQEDKQTIEFYYNTQNVTKFEKYPSGIWKISVL